MKIIQTTPVARTAAAAVTSTLASRMRTSRLPIEYAKEMAAELRHPRLQECLLQVEAQINGFEKQIAELEKQLAACH